MFFIFIRTIKNNKFMSQTDNDSLIFYSLYNDSIKSIVANIKSPVELPTPIKYNVSY